MKKWLRRLRGAVGMGLTWAVAWFGVGVAVGLVNLEAGGAAFGSALAYLAYNSFLSAAAGFLGGAAFSVILGITEGRRRFDQMSLLRFAGWGAVGGSFVGALQVAVFAAMGFPPTISLIVIQGLIGATSAAGTLALARRADDQELLEAGHDVADIGLTEEEKHQLLGRVRPD